MKWSLLRWISNHGLWVMGVLLVAYLTVSLIALYVWTNGAVVCS